MNDTEIDKHLDNWLRDAHALEEQAEQMLKAQSSRIDNYPELSARIEQHLHETQAQRQRLEACLERRGTNASGLKDAGGRFTAMMQAFGGSMAPDEVTKGALASYAFEHFEIASYKCLVAAAEQAGDTETARTCEAILREEEAMAGWLGDRLPDVARTFLQRAEAEMAEAKR
jgi:ferritin-like metal-binding protein YciE